MDTTTKTTQRCDDVACKCAAYFPDHSHPVCIPGDHAYNDCGPGNCAVAHAEYFGDEAV